MASTQQFYRNDLTYNMVTDPKKLPIWLASGTNAPFMATATRTTSTSSTAAFWNNFDAMGTRTWSSTTSSYVTVLNIANSTKPVIMGTFVGRYPNATTTHKVKFTVDGTETIIEPATTWNGRLVVGGINHQGEADTGYGTNAGGMRFLTWNSYGDANGSYAYGYGWVENPMDMLNHGMPVLYAEKDLKVEMWDSSAYASGYYYYAGVTWCTLEDF